jgi:hypothetical protein
MKTIMKLAYLTFAIALVAAEAPSANGELGDLFASLTGTGVNGGGFIYRYTSSGVQSTLASSVSRRNGVALDHSANLFVASATLDGTSYQGTI